MFLFCLLQKIGMADHQDNQEVELKIVETGQKEVKAPPAKMRRLVRAIDKQGGGSSSAPPPTSPV